MPGFVFVLQQGHVQTIVSSRTRYRATALQRHGIQAQDQGNPMKKLQSAALLLSFIFAGSALAAPTYSVEDFVKHPSYGNVRISPNGDYLAISMDHGDQDVLTIMRTSDLAVMKVNQLPDKKSVGAFYWISPNRIMFNAVKKIGGYAQPFSTGEWFAVNADGSQARSEEHTSELQ